MLTVTTSWDDGDPLDQKLAGLLDRHGIRGTFYIPRTFERVERSSRLVQALARNHEIGAHTLTHVDLTSIPRESARSEIEGSKQWVEQISGTPARMFCYPRGRYTEETKMLVADAGFRGARTTKLFSLSSGSPFEMPTTVQVYPFPLRPGTLRAMFQPLQQRFSGYRSLGVPLYSMRSWEAATKAVFDEALRRGGTFHLWGHSWEIERYGMWNEFERVLEYISGHTGCRYVVNAELL